MLKGPNQNLLINRICPNPLMFLQGGTCWFRFTMAVTRPVSYCTLFKICSYSFPCGLKSLNLKCYTGTAVKDLGPFLLTKFSLTSFGYGGFRKKVGKYR